MHLQKLSHYDRPNSHVAYLPRPTNCIITPTSNQMICASNLRGSTDNQGARDHGLRERWAVIRLGICVRRANDSVTDDVNQSVSSGLIQTMDKRYDIRGQLSVTTGHNRSTSIQLDVDPCWTPGRQKLQQYNPWQVGFKNPNVMCVQWQVTRIRVHTQIKQCRPFVLLRYTVQQNRNVLIFLYSLMHPFEDAGNSKNLVTTLVIYHLCALCSTKCLFKLFLDQSGLDETFYQVIHCIFSVRASLLSLVYISISQCAFP